MTFQRNHGKPKEDYSEQHNLQFQYDLNHMQQRGMLVDAQTLKIR